MMVGMKVIQAASLPIQPVKAHASQDFLVTSLPGSSRVTFARLEPGGRIGRHAAPVDQVLVMIEGEASVVAGAQHDAVLAGQAVVFNQGEDHETSTQVGCVAVIVESPGAAEAMVANA